MSFVQQVRGSRGRHVDERWHDQPAGEAMAPMALTSFDLLLDVGRGPEDPEFHDGWQPVRARGADPKSE